MTENANINTVDEFSSLYPNNSYWLHITGLPSETTEEDIFLFFKDYYIKSAKIIK